MNNVSQPYNEAEEIARAEQAVEHGRLQLARRVWTRGNEGQMRQGHLELKPVLIGAAVVVGVALAAVGASLLRSRRRRAWLAPSQKSSQWSTAAKSLGLWALRATVRTAARELVAQAAAHAQASTATPVPPTAK
jgi:hypothetical protein